MHGRGGRDIKDLKERLGLGRRPKAEDATAQGSGPETGTNEPDVSEEDLAELVGLLVKTALEKYRPWIKAADAAVPEVVTFINEAVKTLNHALLALEDPTSKDGLELMRQRAQNRKRQYDMYLETGFSKDEAMQLLVAGFAKEPRVADMIVKLLNE